MSEGMIIRRGGGGGGFDPTGAVLKVVTSAGCIVNVSGTSYSRTQTDAEGFPRSGDANIVEHFFNVPSTAFGTITVTATNTYGTNTKAIPVDTAGNVYEVLLSAPNILLSSEFGKQDGFGISAQSSGISVIYDSDYKTYTIGADNDSGEIAPFDETYDVLPYSAIKITSKQNSTSGDHMYSIYAKDKDNVTVFNEVLTRTTDYRTVTVEFTNKLKTPFRFGFYKRSPYSSYFLTVSEIILL